jgi:hypothetical protein
LFKDFCGPRNPKPVAKYKDRDISNEQNDFDFSLRFSGALKKFLELMEIAPLEHLRGPHESAPTSYKPFEFAEYILDKLLKKSARYRTSNNGGLLLLVYITDWRFNLSETVIALLQYWSATRDHCFEGIYCYSPISAEDGIAQLIYPTPKEFWANFNPELYRENITNNLDPTGWETIKY